tara:strand:+ start:20 stop:355 length:336 start_codon:yes stop_codon:yes gene_type:complete
MKYQKTRFGAVEERFYSFFIKNISGPWRIRSIAFISLLLGFYLGSNLTAYFLQEIGQRPLVVTGFVIFIEVLIRVRSQYKKSELPFIMIVIDNFRIGMVYALILEAFKLGS